MSSVPDADRIWQDARWLAQALDPAKALLRVVAMDAEAYRAASFLDDRMLPGAIAHLLAWDAVARAEPGGARRDARWIFHIGHVGSTLVARLLGELDGVLALREPRLLRDLAMFPPDTRSRFIPGVQALLSRTFEPRGAALVKATSMVSEIAAELVPPGERALMLFASPRSYVCGILAGDNSRAEAQAMADHRAQRLSARGIVLEPSAGRAAHVAAAAWACEMTALEAAADAMSDRRLLWADFDRLLDDLALAILRIADFLGFDAPPARVREIVTGPLVGRYSKALEYDYSPSLRAELLAEAGRDHGAEIDSALAMLERAAEKSPLLTRALRRSNPES